MKRFVLQQLIEWKNREDRKPLILNGARQVGKTWLLHEFAKLEYKKEAYVVCRKNNLARQLFSQDFNVDRILRGLRAMTSVDITPGDTLIILNREFVFSSGLFSLNNSANANSSSLFIWRRFKSISSSSFSKLLLFSKLLILLCKDLPNKGIMVYMMMTKGR